MKTFEFAFSMNTAGAIGWTLFHFLWEGLAIASAFAVLQSFLPIRAAKARYAAGCLALAAMGFAPLVTFLLMVRTSEGPSFMLAPSSAGGPFATDGPAVVRQVYHEIRPYLNRLAPSSGGGVFVPGWGLEPVMPWLAALWLAGVAVMAVRLCAGWLRIRRLWSSQITDVDPDWLERLAELKDRLGVTRPVRLFQSALVEAPAVFGWLRPVILIPVSVLSGLTPSQLESILAHELAHIRRHDYLVNLAQKVLETVLFYHPAVWWVSRRVREERENCCDDLAVEVCGDARTYARALASLEEIRSTPDLLVLATDGGSLLARIHRLLQPDAPTSTAGATRRRVLWGTVLALVVATTLWTWDLSGALALSGDSSFPLFRTLHKATVRFVLLPDLEQEGGIVRSGVPDPGLRQAVERIRSRSILYPVIQDLRLTDKWAAREGRAHALSEEEVMTRLLRHIELNVISDARIISITVHCANADDAVLVANSIAQDYSQNRLMCWKALAQLRVSGMRMNLQSCEKQTHEASLQLAKFRPGTDDGWELRDRLDLLKSQREAWLKKIQEININLTALNAAQVIEILDPAKAER